jgi:glyceraldehyde-3-phosphate dehydrogenase/erythrose-4-phosphate dehydrogenase
VWRTEASTAKDVAAVAVPASVQTWYDNEIGYVNRLFELAQRVGASL